ncbi:hypothetical protein ACN4GH_17645, partial [Burkholderia pseudomallei]
MEAIECPGAPSVARAGRALKDNCNERYLKPIRRRRAVARGYRRDIAARIRRRNRHARAGNARRSAAPPQPACARGVSL